ncbi:9f8295c5-8b08-409b-93b5-ebc76511b7bd [Sclerotinia trifoliorum]|uniref:9f8295c5-8b08-409b-93b5-ebc76511b7bd n=1 Tax=Sclerotinia trifoliorum TaxID=28548 RepID=A0A8H2W5C6_9HELO|nr:9f8295c5-8b08-409b-93b5-ebc76511b7bd [Sclerotinia trifoliorum]
MIPASFASAVALPMFMEALIHMSSLPVLVMLFPLIYLSEYLTLFISFSSTLSARRLSLETIGITIFTTLVLYYECRLTVTGIIFSIGAFIVAGFSRALFLMASQKLHDDEHKISSSYHGYILMTTTFGFLISGSLAFTHETNLLNHYLDSGTVFSYLLSIYCSVRNNWDAKLSLSLSKVIVSGISSILILLISLIFGPVSVVSWVQFSAYFLAMLCLIGVSTVHKFFEKVFEYLQRHVLFRPCDQDPSPMPKKNYVSVLNISLTASAVLSFYALSLSQLRGLSPGPAPSFDNSYTPEPSSFDIVISAYTETPESIARMLHAIKSTSYLSSIDPRVLIYTKDPTVSLSMLKNSTGVDIVKRLPNLGREGGTYLSHIVNEWDHLAAQTMFIQAHAHNIRELIPRINSYLVPQTGMLSLGFSEATCSCNNCGDRFGWKDDWSVIPSLYERIYDSSCSDSTTVLLSYKGQFVASAKRIRGISRGIYEELLSTITSESGWSHDPRFVNKNDSTDNPSFGFAVERIWGLLMQCATDDRVSTKCPSMLSGMIRGSDVGDCQCLDTK